MTQVTREMKEAVDSDEVIVAKQITAILEENGMMMYGILNEEDCNALFVKMHQESVPGIVTANVKIEKLPQANTNTNTNTNTNAQEVKKKVSDTP